jgi:hypothetical protein
LRKILTILIGLIFLVPCSGQEEVKITSDTLQKATTIGKREKNEIQFGTYGVYLDQSTYTELTINGSQTFVYIERGFTGIGLKNNGMWKIQNGKLLLYNYVENNLHSPMPPIWKIKESELCNITKKHRRKGLCLELKK